MSSIIKEVQNVLDTAFKVMSIMLGMREYYLLEMNSYSMPFRVALKLDALK